jgi:plastocyanin
MPAFLLVPVIALGAAFLVACGGDDDDDGANGGTTASPTRPAAAAASPTTAPAAASPTAAAGAQGGTGNNVALADFSYSPARLTVRAGQAAQLTVRNDGQFPHTFTVDNMVDSGSIASGQSKVVNFTPPAAGTFTYYCTIHGAARMSGQLTVQGTTGAVPSDGGPAGGQSTGGSPGSDNSGSSASDTTYDYGY